MQDNAAPSAGDPVGLLQELIRRPSITPETAGVLDLLEGALTPLGFEVNRLRFTGDGSYPVDNLFATRAGAAEGKHLLFAGHTDVVPPGDAAAWARSPFSGSIVDGTIFGRGAADMKSGVAAFVAAAAATVADGSAGRGTISLAITNDEEADAVNGTAKLMAWAEAAGHRFDFCIVGEPSSRERLGDSIKIGRRGSLSGRITVSGTQGHVAYPELAENPLPLAAALITALSGRLDEASEHFPASNLEFTSADVGNATSNVIPASVSLRFNVRYNDRWTPETLSRWVSEAIAKLDPDGRRIQFEVVGQPARSFRSPLDGGIEVLTATIAKLTNLVPEYSTGGGTSDARFIAQYCPVVECGLPGRTMHKVDEHVAVADVEGLARLYSSFIRDFFG